MLELGRHHQQRTPSIPTGLPSIRPVTADLYPLLQRLLRSANHLDPYSRSAAYLAMTGRKGLWLYGDDGSGLMLMRHPNLANTLLALPPFGAYRTGLLTALVQDPRLAGETLQLGRITPLAFHLRAQELARLNATLIEEPVLDWRYPCHVLSTEHLMDRAGQGFKDYRKNLARADRAGLWTRPIEPRMDGPLLRKLAAAWADHHRALHGGSAPAPDTEDPLTSATMTIIALMESGQLPIHGVLVSSDVPQGFMIWEETDTIARHANGLCNVAMPGIKGTSELSYAAMTASLASHGFKTVCIGGSEEAGLDAFKRKLCPVLSEPLSTAILRRITRT